ncbi:chromate resistance protein ChrB domain-containing protein [Ideonella sp. BN130291]|uniref:chromate resistance protein ChrB domain-containing protein n=1 Tax=Ideonella sp. BN130291 TaxID=3112940 RepID=UPI002E26D92A|nr:chromate resistance protein ChrB domain-containing protein [Ideonella sp. BN130291]
MIPGASPALPDWLLLVVSLPTQSATARMRVWRGLKALGCMALRDGAYLLPAGGQRELALRELGDECTREGGVAWLMAVQARSPDEAAAYRQLFDRQEDYSELRKSWKEANRSLARLSPTELVRLQRKLQRDYEALQQIDFFPSDASTEAAAQWLALAKRIAQLLSPDEPQDTAGQVPRLDRQAYRGRTWATRRRPWVDRVASAWLIRRFIDTDARFKWLAQPSDCPRSALGFDFDGAAFTHVGDRVTFETLMASFGLEDDPALARLAAMVHQLDVGGEPVPEAAGFEAVLAGAHERLDDDDALLAEMSAVLDSLYAHYGRPRAGTNA